LELIFLTKVRPQKIFKSQYIVGNANLPWRKGIPWAVTASEVVRNFPKSSKLLIGIRFTYKKINLTPPPPSSEFRQTRKSSLTFSNWGRKTLFFRKHIHALFFLANTYMCSFFT
jgi:hypothetical protein